MSENRRIHLRVGTAAEWATHNPVLALGEPGYESDTKILRIGDGGTPFLSLPGMSIAGDPLINAIAALSTGANQMIYLTGTNTVAMTGLTSAGRALLDDASAAAQLVTLGITATAAELNALDGITASASELNLMDGLTSRQTVITDTDEAFPTSGAVVDHVAARMAGAGQNWVDVTASRTIFVDYQNLTGKLIHVLITFRAGSPAENNQIQFTRADGVTVVRTGNLSGDGSDTDVCISFPVAPNTYYGFLGANAFNIRWLEFR